MDLFQIIGIVGTVIVAGLGIVFALEYKSLKEWLLYAVTVAESYFGSGTGELKLMKVYDMSIAKYKIVAKIITFKRFKKIVDKALEKMENILSTNYNAYKKVKYEDSKPIE